MAAVRSDSARPGYTDLGEPRTDVGGGGGRSRVKLSLGPFEAIRACPTTGGRPWSAVPPPPPTRNRPVAGAAAVDPPSASTPRHRTFAPSLAPGHLPPRNKTTADIYPWLELGLQDRVSKIIRTVCRMGC